MGWWATDTFGGDMPLDIVSDLEEELGISGLYPPESWDKAARRQVREALTPVRQDALLYRYRGNVQDTPEHHLEWGTVTQVLTCLAMAAGAELSSELRDQALQAAQQDEWARSDRERKVAMARFVQTVQGYRSGAPTVVPHKVLVRAMEENSGSGLVNIQPVRSSRGSNQYQAKPSFRTGSVDLAVGMMIPLVSQIERERHL